MAEGTLTKRKWQLMWTNDNSSAQEGFTINVDLTRYTEAYFLFRRNTTDMVADLWCYFIIIIPGNKYRHEITNLIVASGSPRIDYRTYTINTNGTITFSNGYSRACNSTSKEVAASDKLIPYRIYAR